MLLISVLGHNADYIVAKLQSQLDCFRPQKWQIRVINAAMRTGCMPVYDREYIIHSVTRDDTHIVDKNTLCSILRDKLGYIITMNTAHYVYNGIDDDITVTLASAGAMQLSGSLYVASAYLRELPFIECCEYDASQYIEAESKYITDFYFGEYVEKYSVPFKVRYFLQTLSYLSFITSKWAIYESIMSEGVVVKSQQLPGVHVITKSGCIHLNMAKNITDMIAIDDLYCVRIYNGICAADTAIVEPAPIADDHIVFSLSDPRLYTKLEELLATVTTW